MTGAEARALEPALSDGVRAAVLFPREAQCDPVRLVRSVGAAAEALGVRLQRGVEAYGLRADADGMTVESTRGPQRAAHVVLAAGAWSGRLARGLGVPLPLQGGKGYAVEYDRDAVPIGRPLYMHAQRVVANPMADRLRMTGGLLLDGLDERIDPRRIAAIGDAAAAVLRGGIRQPRLSWRGLRPCTPDGLPVVGAHRAVPRLLVATGHGMLGVTLAALTGRLIAGLAAGRAEHPALEHVSPERFDPLPAGVRGTLVARR
jgi:D-amino-acid dehydrogenase